jgi:hypothetical protein
MKMATLILKDEDLTHDGRQTPLEKIDRTHIDFTEDGMAEALKMCHTVLLVREDMFAVFIPPYFEGIIGPYKVDDKIRWYIR